MNGPEWGLLVLLSVLWGATFFFVGVAIRELPPMTIVLARVALAALMLLPLFWFKGYSLPRSFADWMPFVVMGILNNAIPFSFLNAGQMQITSGLASILNATTPLFAISILAVFGEERLSWQRLFGVLLGLIGVGILSGFDGSTVAHGQSQALGIGLCLVGAASYGFAALWGRRKLIGTAPIKSATCQLICTSVIMAVIVGIVDQPWNLQSPSLPTWLSLLGLAFFGSAMAYLVFFTIMVRAGASNVMLVTLLIPISAIALGHLFLDEAIHARDIAGALIIALGLLFIDGRLLPKFSKRSA